MEHWVTHTAFHTGADASMEWSKDFYRIINRNGRVEEGLHDCDIGSWINCGWDFEEINFTLENE